MFIVKDPGCVFLGWVAWVKILQEPLSFWWCWVGSVSIVNSRCSQIDSEAIWCNNCCLLMLPHKLWLHPPAVTMQPLICMHVEGLSACSPSTPCAYALVDLVLVLFTNHKLRQHLLDIRMECSNFHYCMSLGKYSHDAHVVNIHYSVGT